MPFTFSHAALAFPVSYFLKRRVSITGFIAGSMVPDFEYFLRHDHGSVYSHTWAGLFYADLPAGLLLCFFYHGLVRNPLYWSAPLFIKRRMATIQAFNWKEWFASCRMLVVFSVLAGAASHLFWDRLMHHSVPLVKAAGGFDNLTDPTDVQETYFLFWDINSLVGAAVVLYAFWSMPLVKTVRPNHNIGAYWLFFFLSIPAFFLAQLPFLRPVTLDNNVIAVIDAGLLSTLLVSLAFRKKQRNSVPLQTEKAV